MFITTEILEKYHNDGLLLKQTHPVLDLTIWNYKPLVQYDRLWDDVTRQCRGLVTNSDGDIIARPFKKFFNYEEYLEFAPEMIPNESFEVFEKMDGSLGILFNYKDEWVLSTRGSFTSEQSIKGTELLKKYDYNRLPKGHTYLFEIIYPENRIVCNYDFEDLILLGIIYNSDGTEINLYNDEDYDGGIRFKNLMTNLGFKIVKKYDGFNDFDKLKLIISNDAEGFVIRFKNGFRMKIKGDEYCRLHRILTNISNRDLWEYLKENKPLDEILEKVPDEFYNWVKDTVRDLRYNFHSIKEYVGKLFDNIYESNNGDLPIRKTYAEWVLMQEKHLRPILFKMYDRQNYDNIIWDYIYPSYTKPFKNNIDE